MSGLLTAEQVEGADYGVHLVSRHAGKTIRRPWTLATWKELPANEFGEVSWELEFDEVDWETKRPEGRLNEDGKLAVGLTFSRERIERLGDDLFDAWLARVCGWMGIFWLAKRDGDL